MILKFSLIMLDSLKIEADQVKLAQPSRPPAAIESGRGRAAITKCCHLEDGVRISPPRLPELGLPSGPRSFPSVPSQCRSDLCRVFAFTDFALKYEVGVLYFPGKYFFKRSSKFSQMNV